VVPRVIGKPEPEMFHAIVEAAGIDASTAVVIGDNPDADMVAANRAGIASILVLTGVAGSEDVERLRGEQCPTAVAAGPREVGSLLAARVTR
jgi:ribonucleotide monophosphatase NagD (HAD superfamily)